MCPYKEQCFNIRAQENKMDCAGGNEMTMTLIGDMLIKGRDKNMNEKVIKITNIFIDPKSKYTVISSTKANKVGGFEIIQRGSVHILVNNEGDNIVFNNVQVETIEPLFEFLLNDIFV